ncbi:gamma-glutamylcyclotransferase family protein [Beijerinckia sp. 28-YEA-48]|uniref:gamma-glutamylcyclotransferase family protein n=1 Tax=unclassified Beijerinckia TaxID=2638183 RepID=UPI00089873D0|nr:hypothetical protein [Beijerinckia sp. GAS462]SEB63219.1 AIG2-like family protein [Beijerinckia sp. 28-YEA-48]
MPLYFAYGSNMDVAAMQVRCPRSRPVSRAILPRHRFIIMAEGYASVQRDGTRSVHGVLWDVALGDMRTLDTYESIGSGLYTKISQPVLRDAGASVRALVYVGRGKGGGRPLDGYMEAVIAAAKSWQLPENYMRELSALAPGMGQTTTSQGFTQPTVAPKVRPRFATPLDRR